MADEIECQIRRIHDATWTLNKYLEDSMRSGEAITVVAMGTKFTCYVASVHGSTIQLQATGAPDPEPHV